MNKIANDLTRKFGLREPSKLKSGELGKNYGHQKSFSWEEFEKVPIFLLYICLWQCIYIYICTINYLSTIQNLTLTHPKKLQNSL